MDVIEIKGLEVLARHGVLEEEKVTPQPFAFDMRLYLSASAAAAKDDLNLTVNYARACALVNNYCKDNSFDLIETLAYGACSLLLNSFPALAAAEVTVHKPQAPIGLPFADVCFTARRERNRVILSLGSNLGDRAATLSGAIAALRGTEGITVVAVSSVIETEAYGGVAQAPFLNCAAAVDCTLAPRELLDRLHSIEAAFGRRRAVRWGDRTLDIDIVFFGDKIIAEEGLCVPHPDYPNRPFVLAPVKEIAPDFVCPLTHRRMSDI